MSPFSSCHGNCLGTPFYCQFSFVSIFSEHTLNCKAVINKNSYSTSLHKHLSCVLGIFKSRIILHLIFIILFKPRQYWPYCLPKQAVRNYSNFCSYRVIFVAIEAKFTIQSYSSIEYIEYIAIELSLRVSRKCSALCDFKKTGTLVGGQQLGNASRIKRIEVETVGKLKGMAEVSHQDVIVSLE